MHLTLCAFSSQSNICKTNYSPLLFITFHLVSLLCAIRAFEDESKARLGVVECAKHELLQPFSVLHEKEGETQVPQT